MEEESPRELSVSSDLKERLAKFALSLHPEKTRLIEFGRYAAGRRAERGQGKPETFDFLGLTPTAAPGRTAPANYYCSAHGGAAVFPLGAIPLLQTLVLKLCSVDRRKRIGVGGRSNRWRLRMKSDRSSWNINRRVVISGMALLPALSGMT